MAADAEVIDLRSLSPFDDETVTESVQRTGRAIVVHEASRFCGYGAEVAARLSEQCFHYLEAPILRVAGFDIPTRRRTWRNTTCRASTASSTRSTGCSGRTPPPWSRWPVRCPPSCSRIWVRA
jgi:pyruvate/2-oxoglutarate/acetoin dehydrogenase E1 component